MGAPYEKWGYMWPPRPEHALTSDRFGYYEVQGYWAQYKKNGTCMIVWYTPNGDFILYNRHKEPIKNWDLPTAVKAKLKELLPKGKWTVLLAELMHHKVAGIKNTVYFHDILVHESVLLAGETFEKRQEILSKLLPAGAEAYSHYVVSEGIWRAKNFKSDFLKIFKSIKNQKIDEGLVLKNPTAQLKHCYKADSNAGWQIKFRYPTKNYNF